MAWGVGQRLVDHMVQCEKDKAALNEKMDRNHNENSRRLDKIDDTLNKLLTVADVNSGRESEREIHKRDRIAQWTIYATIFAAVIALYADKIFKFWEPK